MPLASPSTTHASRRRRSSARACCRSMATSTDVIETRSRRRSGGPRQGADSPNRSNRRLAGWWRRWHRPGERRSAETLPVPWPSTSSPTPSTLLDAEPGVVLGWYDEIVAAVDRVSAGQEIGPRARGRRGCTRTPRCRDHPAWQRRAGGRNGHAHARRDRLQRCGDDVRRHRDQRRHDDDAVLAPARPTRSRLAALRVDRSLGRECRRGVPEAGTGGGESRPVRDRRHRAGRRLHQAGRSRHRVVDRGQPRPGDVPRSGRLRPLEAQLEVAPGLRPGSSRLRGHPPARGLKPSRPSTPCWTDGRGSGSTLARRRPPGVIFRKPRSLFVRWEL